MTNSTDAAGSGPDGKPQAASSAPGPNATGTTLNALFGSYEGDLPFVRFEQLVETSDPDYIASNFGSLRVLPANKDGVFFLFATQAESTREAWRDCGLTPSVAMWRDGVSAFCWAFETPVAQDTEKLPDLMEFFGMETLGGAIALPGTDGWELVHADPNTFYSPVELCRFYLEEIPSAQEPEAGTFQTYNDARIITPYNESDYEGRQITVSIGPNQYAKNWKPQKLPLAGLIHQFTKHQIGKKDGLAVVLADMVPGQRTKKTIKTCTAIGLDIDTGTPSAVVDKAIAKLGCLAIRATTHSHGKRSSEISKDEILKFHPGADEITSEMIREFLREKKHWDRSIIDSVEFVEEDHTEKGIVCRISHVEMDKHRVIVPLLHPYVIADQGRTQLEAVAKWGKVPAALATKLQVPFDRSCTDPSRLYYLPRHDKGRPFEISLFGGPLFDLASLALDNEFDAIASEFEKAAKGGSKSVTPEGRALGRWWKKYAHGFQIMDVIDQYAPEKKRSKASSGYNIECPFDEDHSNASDRSDQACFAVNAAEGGNEFFLVSCRHAGCQDKTANDMLGKMLKDEWFEATAIEDPNFNIAVIEEDGPPETEPKNPADTFEAVQTEIAGLTKPFSSTAFERLRGLIEGWSDEWQKGTLQKLIAAKAGIETKTVRKTTKKKSTKKTAKVDENATLFFDFVDKPDDVLIRDAFFAHIPTWNGTNDAIPSRQEMPLLTCLLDTPYELRISDGVARFAQLDPVSFRAMCTDMMVLRKLDDGNPGPNEFIPRDLTDVMYNRLWKVAPKTPELIRTPIISADAKILSDQDWYRANNADGEMQTNLFLYPGKLLVPKVSDKPTTDEVREALALIDELIGDFKFCDLIGGGDNGKRASYANALAMLLTPFMRWYFKGWSPLFLIEKPDRGAGASTLAALIQIIFNGFIDSDTTYSDNESEMQKILVTEILKQKMFLWFENIESFSSRILIQALTSEKVGGRILGVSNSIERDNRFIYIATGIKPGLNSEMARRVCCIRLDPKEEDVQKIVYAKDDIKAWALLNRGKLIWALLTLATNWIAKGAKPWKGDPEKALPLKSFENWSHVIGGILSESGVVGFLENPRAASAGSKDHEVKIFAGELFEWMGFHEKTFTEVFEQCVKVESVTGWDKAEKQRNVRTLLNSIHTRTLTLGKFKVQLHDGVDAQGRETFQFRNLDEQ